MEKKKGTPEYQIKDIVVKKEAGEVQICWKSKEGTHFLVCIYNNNTNSDIQLKEVLDTLKKAGMKDSDIYASGHGKTLVYTEPNGISKIYCIREKEFIKNGKKCILSNGVFNKSIPYIIRVYVCQYLKEENKLIVYESEADENTVFIPANITVGKKEEKVLFGKVKKCYFKFPKLDDYINGALMYHVDGIEYDFPLTESCMNNEIVITVPVDKDVHMRTKEEYRNRYKVKINGG